VNSVNGRGRLLSLRWWRLWWW